MTLHYNGSAAFKRRRLEFWRHSYLASSDVRRSTLDQARKKVSFVRGNKSSF